MKKMILVFVSLCIIISGCTRYQDSSSDKSVEEETTINTSSTLDAFKDLYVYLRKNRTTGFVVMKDSEILIEKYWGKSGGMPDNIYSAGKSMCSVLVGIAIDQGYFTLEDRVADIIGSGFAEGNQAVESQITIKHLLNMTSGLSDLLVVENEPGQVWAYSDSWNLLFNVLETSTGQPIQTFAEEVLFDKIGMTEAYYASSKKELRFIRRGQPQYENWQPYQVYCTPKDMANFGQLILQNGLWNGEQIVSQTYLIAATNQTTPLNPAYGYLFWLNASSGGLVPGEVAPLMTNIIPNAPKDLIAALGAGDKKIYMVPSQGLVIIRHGGAAKEGDYAVTGFDNELWTYLNVALVELGLESE